MIYNEVFIKPMREELTRLGVEELRTPEEVDRVMAENTGSLMIVINSVCGCAAGMARPGVALALRHPTLPERLVTVFAGQDREATEQMRSYIKDYPPSSPSIAFFKNGELVDMIERWQIESRGAEEIAEHIKGIFDKHFAGVEG
jgi:putative YphP/YqiW family bacilliredoxin